MSLSQAPIFSCQDFLAITTGDPNANYVLQNNIDCTGVNITPIGSPSSPFQGTVEGYGYTISNVVINTTQSFTGLFSYGLNAVIQNLNLQNVLVYSTGEWVGALFGYAKGVKLHNVNVLSSNGFVNQVVGDSQVGGVSGGYSGATVVNSNVYNAQINSTTTSPYTVTDLVGSVDYIASNLSFSTSTLTILNSQSFSNSGVTLIFTPLNFTTSNPLLVLNGKSVFGGFLYLYIDSPLFATAASVPYVAAVCNATCSGTFAYIQTNATNRTGLNDCDIITPNATYTPYGVTFVLNVDTSPCGTGIATGTIVALSITIPGFVLMCLLILFLLAFNNEVAVQQPLMDYVDSMGKQPKEMGLINEKKDPEQPEQKAKTPEEKEISRQYKGTTIKLIEDSDSDE